MIPKISVIVPVFNRENLIVRCLESLVVQNIKPFEIIVVDNNSTDLTAEVVKKWMDCHCNQGINFKLLTETKRGACPARQKGLINSEGEYLIFFDSDDTMHPELIETAVSKLEEIPASDIICWKCRIKLLNGEIRIPTFLPQNPIEGHLIHTLLRPQGYMIKKEFLLTAGGWEKSLEVWNDFELGLRLLLLNPVITPIYEVLADIYSQEDSITGKDFSSKRGKWEDTLKEMEKENETGSSPQKRSINRILNYRRAILAAHYYRENNMEAGQELLGNTIRNTSFKDKIWLQFSYNFTRLGLRGVWRIVRLLYL